MRKIFSAIVLVSVLAVGMVFLASCTPTPCEHTGLIDIVVDPTCIEQGYTEHICTSCGYVFHDTFVEPTEEDHNYTAIVAGPTCTEAGVALEVCVYCGDEKEHTIKPLGHTFGKWETVVAPTCTEKGLKHQICDACGFEQTEELDITNHKYGESIITLPTCTEKGFTTQICNDCGHVNHTKFVDPVEHTYDAGTVTHPTCSSEGYTTYTCEACAHTMVSEYTPVVDHALGNWEVVIEATCESLGLEKRVCADCDYYETREVIGHNYIADDHKNPTCDEAGYTKYVCDKCGHSYIENYEDALGHDFGDWYLVEGYDNLERRDCACGHYEVRSLTFDIPLSE